MAGEVLEAQRRVRSGLGLSTLRLIAGLSAESFNTVLASAPIINTYHSSHVDTVQ